MNRSIVVALSVLVLSVACNNNEDPATQTPEADTTTAEVKIPFAPGHFGGALPCADCDKHRLNAMLWSTGSAFVRDEKLNAPGGTELKQEWGRWKLNGERITVTQEGQEIYSFTVKDQNLIAWEGSTGSDQPGATDMPRQKGTLTPGIEVDVIGTYYTPDHPSVAHVRECASGKDFIVRLDPAAADIHSRFEELNINLSAGITAQMFGRIQPVPGVDPETGADKVLFTIKSWSGFLPDKKCSGK